MLLLLALLLLLLLLALTSLLHAKVAVPGVYDTKFVEKVRAAQDEHFSAFLKKQEGKKLEHMESEDAAARSAGRYEVRLPVEAPFTDAALVENGHLLQVTIPRCAHACSSS